MSIDLLEKTLEETKKKKIDIEIFGLGYVGLPLAVRLATAGFKVRGIDINSDRIKRLEKNQLMESELLLKKEFLESHNNGNLNFSTNPAETHNPKIGIICVPTPIPSNKTKSNIFVKSAIENFLNTSKKGDLILIESSIEVGTTEDMMKLIETNGFNVGVDFGCCFCPERIDPQNTKWNLENIPRVIFCSDDISFQIAQFVYQYVNNSNLFRVKLPKIAEVVKSYENAFRLVNISLVNELAILCDKLGIDVSDVINAASTKPFGFMRFNSGAGAGGHCIPKDPRFLLESSKQFGFNFRTIEDALEINSFMPKYIVESIEKIISEKNLKRSIIICGLSYKPDIEDMRDSPGFKILNELNQKNFDLAIFDPFFKPELLDKYFIENNMEKLDFEILNDLSNENLQKYDCLCITQHHTQTKFRINEIYNNSLVSLIYDCQNKIEKNPNSKTILKGLGS